MELKKELKKILKADVSISSLKLKHKAAFAKNLSVLLRGGITITKSLEILKRESQGTLKKVIQAIYDDVNSGYNLAESLERRGGTFRGVFIETVRSGETSGTLRKSLENISKQLKREYQINERLKGALVYPVLVMVASLVMGIFLVIYILPQVTSLFSSLNVKLPLTTRVLISISQFIQTYTIEFLITLFASIFFFWWLLTRKFTNPITHWIFLRIPVANKITRYRNLSKFCGILSLSLNSGLTIDKSLAVTKKTVGNFYYRKAIGDLYENVVQGNKIASSLRSHKKLFPPMVVEMTEAGEASGNLSSTLSYLSQLYEEESKKSVDNITKLVEPLLLLIVGAGVAFLALSIVTPIYEITGSLSR